MPKAHLAPHPLVPLAASLFLVHPENAQTPKGWEGAAGVRAEPALHGALYQTGLPGDTMG